MLHSSAASSDSRCTLVKGSWRDLCAWRESRTSRRARIAPELSQDIHCHTQVQTGGADFDPLAVRLAAAEDEFEQAEVLFADFTDRRGDELRRRAAEVRTYRHYVGYSESKPRCSVRVCKAVMHCSPELCKLRRQSRLHWQQLIGCSLPESCDHSLSSSPCGLIDTHSVQVASSVHQCMRTPHSLGYLFLTSVSGAWMPPTLTSCFKHIRSLRSVRTTPRSSSQSTRLCVLAAGPGPRSAQQIHGPP